MTLHELTDEQIDKRDCFIESTTDHANRCTILRAGIQKT